MLKAVLLPRCWRPAQSITLSMNWRLQRWVSRAQSLRTSAYVLISFVGTGHTTLFLSTNNSVPALTHLLKTTGATTLVVHPSLIANAKGAIAELAEDATNQSCQLVDIADKSLWDNDESVKPYPRALTPEQEGPLPVFIVHSSGSTGFPKVSPRPQYRS